MARLHYNPPQGRLHRYGLMLYWITFALLLLIPCLAREKYAVAGGSRLILNPSHIPRP